MTGQFCTARHAARRPTFTYRDSRGQDVEIVEASEDFSGKRVTLTLSDGRSVVVDWNHRLRVVKHGH